MYCPTKKATETVAKELKGNRYFERVVGILGDEMKGAGGGRFDDKHYPRYRL